jgi:hypothetical protein
MFNNINTVMKDTQFIMTPQPQNKPQNNPQTTPTKQPTPQTTQTPP